LDLIFCIDKWLGVTWHTQPCRPCEITYILHYLPRGMNHLPGGSWGICAPALPEGLTLKINFEHMRRAWDPQQPVESLFKQIQD
jgi:hypothetical protein